MQEKNVVKKKQVSDITCFSKYRYKKFAAYIGFGRRIVSLIYSNLFFNGQIINKKAFLKEIEFLKARRKKNG